MRVTDYRRTTPKPGLSGEQVRKHAPDYWILLLTVALLAIGLIVVYSISPALAVGKGVDGSAYVMRQVISIGIGLILFFIASRIPVSLYRKFAIPLLVIAGVATLITLLLPVNADYPAHRWIRIGGLSFQSVELLKFAIIVWLAGFIVHRQSRNKMQDFSVTLQPLLFVMAGVGFVVAVMQSDLGSAFVVLLLMAAMAFVGGLSIRHIGLLFGLMVVGVAVLIGSSDYRRERISTFMNPSIECSTSAEGYQACQALIAVGSGGMAGLGLGNSVQAYGYLPEPENDSIFAIYAEKFGFIGVSVLLGLLIALYSRIKRVVDGAPDEYSKLVVLGIFVWLSTQAFINIAAMIGLVPLKGITLPLISYGGSSVIMVLAVLGVVFQVSRYTKFTRMRDANIRRETHENSRNGRRVRGAYHTPFGGRS